MALSLDAVGDRWTLLLVRELLLGAKRYGELADALPAMGTNLLAERLKRLEAEGLVGRAGDGGYELTEHGRELEDVVLALARWGLGRMPGPGREAEVFRPQWLMLSLRAMFRPEEAAGVDEEWEYRIGDDVFHLLVRDGSISAADGPATEPVLIWATDADTFRSFGTGESNPIEALASGRLTVEGDAAVIERALRILPPPGVTLAS